MHNIFFVRFILEMSEFFEMCNIMDEEIPRDNPALVPDGEYYPRILFIGKNTSDVTICGMTAEGQSSPLCLELDDFVIPMHLFVN